MVYTVITALDELSVIIIKINSISRVHNQFSFTKLMNRRKENCVGTQTNDLDAILIHTPYSPALLHYINTFFPVWGLARRFGLCAGPNESVSRQSKQNHCYCSCTWWKAGAKSKSRGQMAPPESGNRGRSIFASLHCSRMFPCNADNADVH
jgi:hypothetical protein